MFKRHAFLIFFIIYICFGISSAKAVLASEKTVRIPDYGMEGFIYTDDTGLKMGYSYEIFQEIAKYTDWNYEYVKCDRSQCLDMLKNGELDIIDSLIYTEERAKEVNYSDINAGYGNKILITKKDDDKYNSNDFKNYSGMKIGIVNEDFWKDAVNKIAAQKGFTPDIVIFDSYKENYDALAGGVVDAIVTMDIQNSKDYKVLCEFDLTPYYFAVNKENTKLLNELNQAMAKVWNDDNTYFIKTYSSYLKNGKSVELLLTDDEKKYIEENNTIKASLTGNRPPMTAFDEKKGEYSGIVADIIKLAASKAGFNIEFEKAENYKEAMHKLRRGESNIICDFFFNYSWAEKNGIKMTPPYFNSLEYSEVINKDKINSDKKTLKIAYVDNYFFNEKFLFAKFRKEQLTLYNSEDECIDAVNKGEADAAYIISYVAEKIISEKKYNNIEIFDYPEFRHAICIGVGKNEDIRLLTILSKAVESISADEINNIIEKNCSFGGYEGGIGSFIEENIYILTIFILSLAVICGMVIFWIFRIRKRYGKTIFDLAYIDNVTGIWNLNGFILEANKKINHTDFRNQKLAVMFFDILKFKLINEHYGKITGNNILKYVSGNISETLPDGGIISRAVSDNFIILFPFHDKKECFDFLKKIFEKMKYYKTGKSALELNFQCGMFIISDKGEKLNNAVDMAKAAMKDIEPGENNGISIFDKRLENKIIREKEIIRNMKKAFKEREFIIYYQPKIDIRTEKIAGAEALVRWISKKSGFMNPNEFLPIFEKQGVIAELDYFVLEEIFKLIKEWIDDGKVPLNISLNQSNLNVNNPFYADRLEKLIKKYEIPAKYIELEFTESIFMETNAASEVLNKLKNLGFSISVENHISGFPPIDAIEIMPIDTVKIDGSFLNKMEKSDKAKKIMLKIIEILKELNINIICEGVERTEQVQLLKSIGVFYAQGFLYSKPVPETEFRKKVKNMVKKNRGARNERYY